MPLPIALRIFANEMIHFTADTHFGHANIIKYCGRPFETKADHDNALVENWNKRVKPKDVVYHLGDFGFAKKGDDNNISYLCRVASKLHGTIVLIKGNHDGPATQAPLSSRFQVIKDVHVIKHQGERLFLSHYPHRSWQHSFRGAIHLFGHVHGGLPPHGLSFDVGVDCWNFEPISFDMVMCKVNELRLSGVEMFL